MHDESGRDDDGDVLEGRYANYFKVGHNAFEFLLDFGQLYAETERPQLHTRIITTPTYARELLKILTKSIDQHRRTFGTDRGE